MKSKCPHGSVLPRGLRCDRGYLIIRLFTDKGPYNRGCGLHTKEMEAIARIELSRLREAQYLGTFGLPQKTKRLKFEDAWPVFHKKHYVDYRDPKTHAPRSKLSVSNAKYKLQNLNEYFGQFYMDGITLKDLKNYRAKRIEFDGISGSTLNREMADLNSMFVQFKRWNMEDPNAEQVALPKDNPCEHLPDFEETPRNRVASEEELARLHQACIDLDDQALWSIIETELCTSLRLGDLKSFHEAKIDGDKVTVRQGKTGKEVSFPAHVRPNWAKVFVNFQHRWEAARLKAVCADIQWRDLRKTGLRMMEALKDKDGNRVFTSKDIAGKAGHADERTTKKWYLSNENSEEIASMVEATKQIIEKIKNK